MTDTPRITNPMQQAVHEFLIKHLGAQSNNWPNKTLVKNKWLLIMEEFSELTSALGIDVFNYDNTNTYASGPQYEFAQPRGCNTADAIKEMCDLLYVIFNLAEELEIDIQPFFDEVHRSNMTKTPAALSPNQKVMKGPDYRPPRIRELLEAYRADPCNPEHPS